jgi:hypothetical protein
MQERGPDSAGYCERIRTSSGKNTTKASMELPESGAHQIAQLSRRFGDYGVTAGVKSRLNAAATAGIGRGIGGKF